MKDFKETCRLMRQRGPGEANKLAEMLNPPHDVPGLKFDWSVTYEELGHDIIIDARLTAVDPSIALLQVFLQDSHPGVWIPEFRPWVLSGVEFQPSQNVKATMARLIDSKWRKEDTGEKYNAYLWGYVQAGAKVLQFGPHEKEFIYPG